jgi:hypothetical protein
VSQQNHQELSVLDTHSAVEEREKEVAAMDSAAEGMDLAVVVMDLVEVGMDLAEAAMVQLEPEVAVKVLPEAVEMVVVVKVAAVMAKPEPKEEEVMAKLEPKEEEVTAKPEPVEEVMAKPEPEVEEEVMAKPEPEVEEEVRVKLVEEEMVVVMVQLEEIAVEELGETEVETLRNRPEIRRVVSAVEIAAVVQVEEDSAAAASVKKERVEAKPQRLLPRELPVRAVAEVADLREAVARSLRLALAVLLEAEVVDEEEEEEEVVVVVVTLQQSQPRAIEATAVEVREWTEQSEGEAEEMKFQPRPAVLFRRTPLPLCGCVNPLRTRTVRLIESSQF